MIKDEALKLALDALEVCEQSNYGRNWVWPDTAHPTAMKNVREAITAIKEALSSCQCPECKVLLHASDCAVHNEPAYPKGECNCGAQPEQEQLMSDQINYGMSVTQGGKRIDPMSIYKEPEQEPVVWMYQNKSTHEVRFQKHMRSFVDHSAWYEVPLYSEPLANQEKTSGSPKPAKPEALRLADAMEYDLDWCDEAAAELRRMHDLLGKANALCRIRAEEIERLKAQPEQKPVAWKLVPVEPTKEMLKAMDECSKEGYDERLYAGHAASVYMAAVDVAPTPPQPWEKFCDSNCVWTDHHPDCKLAEQEPAGHGGRPMTLRECMEAEDPEQEPRCEAIIEVFGKDWRLDYMSLPVGKHKLYTQQYTYTTPPQRKPLTDEEIILIVAECAASHQHTDIHFARAIERAHGIKGEA